MDARNATPAPGPDAGDTGGVTPPEWVVYSTGSAPLDLVLGGGIPATTVVEAAGMPGTGKTILAEQF